MAHCYHSVLILGIVRLHTITKVRIALKIALTPLSLPHFLGMYERQFRIGASQQLFKKWSNRNIVVVCLIIFDPDD